MKRKAILILLLISVWLMAFFVERLTDEMKSRVLPEKILYFPSGEFLKPVLFGFDAVMADFLWARTVVYFGGQFRTTKDYTWLYHMVDIVTTLEPTFIGAYRFGGTLLAIEANRVDDSIKILQKGIEHNPGDWRLYFALAFDYMYYKQDYETAAKYYERAARFPGHPPYLPRLVARLYAKTGKIEAALDYLIDAYKRYDDPNIKSAIAGRIKLLIAKRDSIFLEEAASKYKELFGEYPKDLNLLVKKGLTKSLPTEPHGGEYQIDPTTGKVKSSVKMSDWP